MLETDHPTKGTVAPHSYIWGPHTQATQESRHERSGTHANYPQAIRVNRKVTPPGSPKFGGKSQIALSSGHECHTAHYHGASRRHSAVTGADAADGSAGVVRRPLSYAW